MLQSYPCGRHRKIVPGIAHVVHLLALLVAHEAARVAEAPGGAGRPFRARPRAALVRLALHADVISVGVFTHISKLVFWEGKRLEIHATMA